MKRFLACLLFVTLVISCLSACRQEVEYDFTTRHETVAEEDPEAVESSDVLTFTYVEQDLQDYYALLENYKQLAISSDDVSLLEELDPQIEEQSVYLMDQQSIASVLYYCDMSDDEASQRYLDMTDVLTEVQEKTNVALREIYESDSKLKAYVFEDWTEEDIQELLSYNSEIKELEQRNAQLLVDYQALSDEELQTDIGTLYAEFVANNNRMAQIYGYGDYYDYAAQRLRMRDYSSLEVNQMRAYAQAYLAPALEASAKSFQSGYYDLSDLEADRLMEFIEEDYNNVSYLDTYLDILPEDVAADMRRVFDGRSVFPKSRKAMEGAFTTMIGNDPFCYFSRDYRDTCTLVHEMGHFYGGLYCDISMMPLDLAEIQSQGNEWLLISCMEDELKTEVYSCYLDCRIMEDIGTILIGLIVDEFEEKVYKSEGVSQFTTEDFEEIMLQVCEKYGGYDFLCYYLTDVQTYWRMVVVEQPVYYISYSTSLLPSLDLYFVACEDWDEALEIYMGLTCELEEEAGFLEALESAGLCSPFDEQVYITIASLYDIEGSVKSNDLEYAA